MSRKRILVVDDDRGILRLYRTALSLAGFQVEWAEDGFSALQRIESRLPDLIVLDLHLPCVDGMTVLSELRANSNTASIPVVVVTGTDCADVIPDAAVILRKPCEPERLISVIEQHIYSPAA